MLKTYQLAWLLVDLLSVYDTLK